MSQRFVLPTVSASLHRAFKCRRAGTAESLSPLYTQLRALPTLGQEGEGILMNDLKRLLTARLFEGKRIVLPVVLATVSLAALSASAQQKPTIAGDYLGTLGPLHVKLHLKVDPTGSVAGRSEERR